MEHYSHMIDVRLKLLRLKFPSNPSPSLYRTPNLEERERKPEYDYTQNSMIELALFI